MEVIRTFIDASKMIVKDKVLLFFCSIPVVMGLVLFGFMGGWVYSTLLPWGSALVDSYINISWLGSILGWIVKSLVIVLFFFLTNWTFVLAVGLLACPFNDLIASRVEKKSRGKETLTLGESFSSLPKRIIFTIKNETKKIGVIILLTLISLIFSLFPILAPISFLIQGILIAVNFLDYNWSRHEFSLGTCFKNYRENFLGYSVMGLLGGILLSIPVLNLTFYPILLVSFALNFSKQEII